MNKFFDVCFSGILIVALSLMVYLFIVGNCIRKISTRQNRI